jgi:hypothetical protein
MKFIENASWTDERGIVHVLFWGSSGSKRGWFILCDGRFYVQRSPEIDQAPKMATCVYCAVSP